MMSIDKIKMFATLAILMAIGGTFGHEVYHSARASGDSAGPIVRQVVETWWKSPPMMMLVGAAAGALMAHPHGGGGK